MKGDQAKNIILKTITFGVTLTLYVDSKHSNYEVEYKNYENSLYYESILRYIIKFHLQKC